MIVLGEFPTGILVMWTRWSRLPSDGLWTKSGTTRKRRMHPGALAPGCRLLCQAYTAGSGSIPTRTGMPRASRSSRTRRVSLSLAP